MPDQLAQLCEQWVELAEKRDAYDVRVKKKLSEYDAQLDAICEQIKSIAEQKRTSLFGKMKSAVIGNAKLIFRALPPSVEFRVSEKEAEEIAKADFPEFGKVLKIDRGRLKDLDKHQLQRLGVILQEREGFKMEVVK